MNVVKSIVRISIQFSTTNKLTNQSIKIQSGANDKMQYNTNIIQYQTKEYMTFFQTMFYRIINVIKLG